MTTQTNDQGMPVIEYSVTDAAISALAKKYEVLPDVETDEGYKWIHAGAMEVRGIRTGLDKARKEKTAAARAFTKAVNDRGNELIARIEAIEKPLKDAKAIVDERKKREAEEKARVEQERKDAITAKIQAMRDSIPDSVGKTADEIETTRQRFALMPITEDGFAEFHAVAEQTRETTVNTLSNMVTQARAAEELAELKRANAEREAVEAKQEPDLVPETFGQVVENIIDKFGLPQQPAAESIPLTSNDYEKRFDMEIPEARNDCPHDAVYYGNGEPAQADDCPNDGFVYGYRAPVQADDSSEVINKATAEIKSALVQLGVCPDVADTVASAIANGGIPHVAFMPPYGPAE